MVIRPFTARFNCDRNNYFIILEARMAMVQSKTITTKEIGEELDKHYRNTDNKDECIEYFFLDIRITKVDYAFCNNFDPLDELKEMPGRWQRVEDWSGVYFGKFPKEKIGDSKTEWEKARDTEARLSENVRRPLLATVNGKLKEFSRAINDDRVPKVYIKFSRACLYTPEGMETD